MNPNPVSPRLQRLKASFELKFIEKLGTDVADAEVLLLGSGYEPESIASARFYGRL